MNMKKSSLIVAMIMIFILGVGSGFGLSGMINGSGSNSSAGPAPNTKSADLNYDKVNELWNIIQKDYYREPDMEKVQDGLAKGLMAGLEDPYSGYMTKKEYESYETSMMGEYDGIGLTFNQNKEGEFKVVSTIKGAPAEKGGIKKGDTIVKVDGKEYDDADSIGSAMRGKSGTKVKVTYVRDKKETTVTLTREHIIQESVESKVLDGNIGYIKIIAFEENTDKDFDKALSDMEAKAVKGLVIDMRDNGGGLVKSAINIADHLLGKTVVTYLEDRAGKKEYYKSDENQTGLPYVLLVNGNTASASEIISAAVKDKGKGKIVGTKTYGKGVVQISDKLSDGSGYRLTIMQYFSPNGNQINEKGVEPDFIVKDKDQQLKKAEELINKGF